MLPLRLYVDQDALDFLMRFCEFKSDVVPPASVDEIPFLRKYILLVFQLIDLTDCGQNAWNLPR